MKTKITAIILSAILAFSLMPFSIIKAATNVTQFANGLFDYGSWTTYYAVNTNGYVITDMFETINVPAQWESALITKVVMNNYYSGQITLQLTGNINTNLWEYYVEGDGVYSLRTTDNNKISIYLNNSNEFYIYAFCGNDNDTNFVPSAFTYPGGSLEVSPSVPEFYNSFNEYQLIDHYFPSWNLTAYLWGKSYGEYTKMFGLDLPFVSIPRSTSALYEINHRIPILRNQKIVVYFLSDQFISNANTYVSTASGVSVDKTNVQYSFPRLQIGSSNQVFYLNELSVDLGDQSATQFSVGFNVANVHVYPIFIGNYDNIPDSVALMKSGEYRNTYTKLLQQIIDVLNGQNNPTNPSTDINNTADELTDLHDQENQIVSDFHDNLTDFNTNMDLTGYDFITGLNNSNNYFKMLLDQMYVESSSIRAFWVIPLILVILTVLLGR